MKKQPKKLFEDTQIDDAIDIVIIVDESGSMAPLHASTINGFNEFLSAQRALGGEAYFTAVFFNQTLRIAQDRVPLAIVRNLQRSDYRPNGMTALHDAMGITLNKLFARNAKRVVMCVITDGEENSSTEHTSTSVRAAVTRAEDAGWKIVYLGANQDSFKVAKNLGIPSINTANFAATNTGVGEAYRGISCSVSNYRTGI